VRSSGLLGCQVATRRIVPPGRSDGDAAELARRIGLVLDPWQESILVDSGRQSNGRWSAFESTAIIPRQNGKSFLIVARALAGALLYEEELILYSAHEYRTAQETWRIIRDICESEPVNAYVKPGSKGIRVRPGSEEIHFRNGSRFKLMARTRSSGRGFFPDCLLLDEAFALSQDVMSSVLPSMAARPNPQVYYFSSAGTWESEVLLGLRRRGHQSTSRNYAYWEWHADPTDDTRDPRVWAAANPALGYRITPEAIEREHESMTKKAFQRERLGIWSETATESVLREEDVTNSIVSIPAPPRDGRPIGWGVDVAWDRTGSAIAAAYHDDDGNAVLVLVDAAPGAGWVPGRLAERHGSYGPSGFAYDARGGITDLMQRAERDYDVPSMPLKHADYPAACANLAQRLADGSLRFAAAPALLSDATGAIANRITGGWVWERKVVTPPTHLIAATCALWALEHDEGGTVAVY
jgi:hypothetical protein